MQMAASLPPAAQLASRPPLMPTSSIQLPFPTYSLTLFPSPAPPSTWRARLGIMAAARSALQYLDLSPPPMDARVIAH